MLHRLRVICRNFPRKFIKLSMETPYLCPSEGHKHGRRDVRETIWNLILLLIATTFGSWSIILLHKQHLVHSEYSICKNGKERSFLNQKNFITARSLTYGGELKYSKCSVFKMKGTTKLEICKKIYFKFILLPNRTNSQSYPKPPNQLKK